MTFPYSGFRCVLTVIIAATFAMCVVGADKDTAKKPKRQKPPLLQANGEITSISADAVTIKTTEGAEMKLVIIPGTVLGSQKSPKTVEDFKPGDKVSIRYKDDGTNKIARAITPPTAAEKAGDKKPAK